MTGERRRERKEKEREIMPTVCFLMTVFFHVVV